MTPGFIMKTGALKASMAEAKIKTIKKDDPLYKKVEKNIKFLKKQEKKHPSKEKALTKQIADTKAALATYRKEGTALDKQVSAVTTKVADDKKASKDVKAVAKMAATPITHRANVQKVAGSLDAFAKTAPKPGKTKLPGGDTDKDAKGGSPVGIIIGVIAGAAVIGGVTFCYCKKMCCFKPAEEGGNNEGGDKDLFKSEIKSKSAHKRHTKESLMPSFKVAEEEA